MMRRQMHQPVRYLTSVCALHCPTQQPLPPLCVPLSHTAASPSPAFPTDGHPSPASQGPATARTAASGRPRRCCSSRPRRARLSWRRRGRQRRARWGSAVSAHGIACVRVAAGRGDACGRVTVLQRAAQYCMRQTATLTPVVYIDMCAAPQASALPWSLRPDRRPLVAVPVRQAKVQGEAWRSALARAKGEKVLDDPKLLRRCLKREAKRKEKNTKAWKERSAVQKDVQQQRQAKRKGNLDARRQVGEVAHRRPTAARGRARRTLVHLHVRSAPDLPCGSHRAVAPHIALHAPTPTRRALHYIHALGVPSPIRQARCQLVQPGSYTWAGGTLAWMMQSVKPHAPCRASPPFHPTQVKFDNKKAKREKKLLRPGFEGRKEGFITPKAKAAAPAAK